MYEYQFTYLLLATETQIKHKVTKNNCYDLHYRNRQNKKYRKGPQNIEHEDTFMPDTFMDTEGKECVMIANPTYDSLYQKQTQA